MKLGQKIFLMPNTEVLKRTMNPIIETEVSKVGRKYFWIKGYDKIKFLIKDINYPIGNNFMVKIRLNNAEKRLSVCSKCGAETEFLKHGLCYGCTCLQNKKVD